MSEDYGYCSYSYWLVYISREPAPLIPSELNSYIVVRGPTLA